MTMKLSQKRTCSGCRALEFGQYSDKCLLGYSFDKKHVPQEKCPKPTTISELIFASNQANGLLKRVTREEAKQ